MTTQPSKNFKFRRVVSGHQVGSKCGMLSKLKWKVLAFIFNKCDIKYNPDHSFNDNRSRMIRQYINTHTDKQFYCLLKSTTDKMIQPSLLTKFNNNKQQALENYLIRYEEWEK